MALLFKDPNKISAYRDRRFPGTQEDYEHALQTATTVYIGNMSFYTTEEQLYELFSRAGEIKKIVMGLDKNTKTPCGFCFVIGGYGKLVQKELEEQREVVDYGVGSLGSFQPPHMAHNYGRHGGGGGGHGYGGSHRQGRGDYHRKRYRDDDRRGPDNSQRNSEHESRRNSDHDSRQEKNPRFREHGDSDDEEDDRKRQK
ncbi:hypothetical protein L1987_75577 [Smallanthus sonchifolius]|uniref:Uncharacterized protein n=1 Tax=Smallanthus sonchifolius TaxID=185202 RepID=A0ACB9A731_9ASTR|nr:hypothetical protein L1987_75577 [Smallanthus sonchifolius]